MVSQILWAALDCLLGHVLILVAFDAGDSRSTAERQMAIAIQASIDRPPVDLDPIHTQPVEPNFGSHVQVSPWIR